MESAQYAGNWMVYRAPIVIALLLNLLPGGHLISVTAYNQILLYQQIPKVTVLPPAFACRLRWGSSLLQFLTDFTIFIYLSSLVEIFCERNKKNPE